MTGLLDLGASAMDVAGKVGSAFLQDHFNRKSSDRAFNQSLQASSTQYQRAVADLKAAGLNPILAASGFGGSSPSASALGVSGQNIDLVGSGLATGSAQATRELQKSQGGAADAAKQASMAGAALANQQAEVAATQIPVNSALAAKNSADALVAREQATKLRMSNDAYAKLSPHERLAYDTGQIGGMGASISSLVRDVGAKGADVVKTGANKAWSFLGDAERWIRDKLTPKPSPAGVRRPQNTRTPYRRK